MLYKTLQSWYNEIVQASVLAGENLRENEVLAKHADWMDMISSKYDNINADTIDGIIRDEIGLAFKDILECAGVYKRTEDGKLAFLRFIEAVNRA